jgi:hypothetical protein
MRGSTEESKMVGLLRPFVLVAMLSLFVVAVSAQLPAASSQDASRAQSSTSGATGKPATKPSKPSRVVSKRRPIAASPNRVIKSKAKSAPAAPTGLKATSGRYQISLSWSADRGASTYNVYRGTFPGGESDTPIKTGLRSTSFLDSGLDGGQQYFYLVVAVNSAGKSGWSNEAMAIAALGPEEAAWQAADTLGTQDAYFDFHGKYPHSTHLVVRSGPIAWGQAMHEETGFHGSTYGYVLDNVTIGDYATSVSLEEGQILGIVRFEPNSSGSTSVVKQTLSPSTTAIVLFKNDKIVACRTQH